MSIIVALDANNQHAALALADQLDPDLCHIKVGKELFTHVGPQIVQALHQRDFKVFLDLKFHDIPNTTAMANAARAPRTVSSRVIKTPSSSRGMASPSAANFSSTGAGLLCIVGVDGRYRGNPHGP